MILLGSRQIGIAKMKEHRKMSRLVSRSQAKQRVSSHVNGHVIRKDALAVLKKTSTFTIRLLQCTKSPQK